MRRLVEGEALEVAEHHRRAEGIRQAVDLAVERLGLLVVDHLLGLDGGTGLRPAGRPGFLGPAPAGEPAAGLARRAEGHAVEPVAQQVGVSDGGGLSCQDEEDGLEGVLGVMAVAQELPADAQDHRPVPRHQGGESGIVARGREPLEELAIGESGHRAAREERAELTGQ